MANDIDIRLNFSDDNIGQQLNALEKDFADLNKSVTDTNKNIDKSFKEASTSVGGLGSSFGSLGKAIPLVASALAGLKLGDLAVQAIRAADQFRQLQLTFGRLFSGDAVSATKKLNELIALSNELGISSQELTDTYASLANRGFKPTRDELIKLIDFAKASNKSVNQLSEAILDAQSLEFERLKEFGVKSKVAGDQVTFTFNGVSKTVKNSADEIQRAILGFGNLASVQGAAAAAASSVEAAQNRFNNSLNRGLTALGSYIDKGAGGFISAASGIIDSLTDMIDPLNASNREFNEQRNLVATLDGDLPQLIQRYKELEGQKKLNTKEQSELNEVTAQIAKIAPFAAEGFGKYTDGLRINLGALQTYTDAQKSLYKQLAESESIVTRNRLTEIKIQKKALEEQQKNIGDFELGVQAKNQLRGNLQKKYNELLQEEIIVAQRSVSAQEQLKVLADGGIVTKEKEIEQKKKAASATSEESKEAKKLRDELEKLRERLQQLGTDAEISLLGKDTIEGARLVLQRELEEIQSLRDRLLDLQKGELSETQKEDLSLLVQNAAREFQKVARKVNNEKLLIEELLPIRKLPQTIGEVLPDVDKQLAEIGKSISKLNTKGVEKAVLDPITKLREGIKDALGLDDEQLDFAVGQLQDLGAAYLDFFVVQNQAAVKANEELVRSLDERISIKESALAEELEREKAGTRNNVSQVKEELALIKQEREKALIEGQEAQQKAQRAQLIADGISQVSSLAVSVANIIKGFSKVPIIGAVLGIAAAGAMLLQFATLRKQAENSRPKFRHGRDPREGYQAKGKTHEQGGIDVEIENDEFVMGTKQSKKHAPFLRRMLKGEFDKINLENLINGGVMADRANQARVMILNAQNEQTQANYEAALRKVIGEQTSILMSKEQITGVGNKLVKVKKSGNGTITEIINL